MVPEDYLIWKENEVGVSLCHFAFKKGRANYNILGAQTLRGYYTTFEYTEGVIGVGPTRTSLKSALKHTERPTMKFKSTDSSFDWSPLITFLWYVILLSLVVWIGLTLYNLLNGSVSTYEATTIVKGIGITLASLIFLYLMFIFIVWAY